MYIIGEEERSKQTQHDGNVNVSESDPHVRWQSLEVVNITHSSLILDVLHCKEQESA